MPMRWFMVLVDGIVFVLLTVTGLRKVIFDAIPQAVKVAISAGIGLFIAFIGMQNAGIVVDNACHAGQPDFVQRVHSASVTWAQRVPDPAHDHHGLRHRRDVQEEGQGRGPVGHSRFRGSVLRHRPADCPRLLCADKVQPNLSSDFFGAFKDFGTHGVRQGLHRRL